MGAPGNAAEAAGKHRQMRHRSMEYRIVHAASPSALEGAVNTAIEDGWLPIGGVAIEVTSSTTFYQAMTRDSSFVLDA